MKNWKRTEFEKTPRSYKKRYHLRNKKNRYTKEHQLNTDSKVVYFFGLPTWILSHSFAIMYNFIPNVPFLQNCIIFPFSAPVFDEVVILNIDSIMKRLTKVLKT